MCLTSPSERQLKLMMHKGRVLEITLKNERRAVGQAVSLKDGDPPGGRRRDHQPMNSSERSRRKLR